MVIDQLLQENFVILSSDETRRPKTIKRSKPALQKAQAA
jgi:hypothetical protein